MLKSAFVLSLSLVAPFTVNAQPNGEQNRQPTQALGAFDPAAAKKPVENPIGIKPVQGIGVGTAGTGTQTKGYGANITGYGTAVTGANKK